MPSIFQGRPHVFVTTDDQAAGWARAHMEEFHAALPEIGIELTLVVGTGGMGSIPMVPNSVFVDMGCKSKFPAGVRRFSMMVDHPCYLMRNLEGVAPDTVLGWVDRQHPGIARMLNLPFRSGFLPHAGPRPNPSPRDMADRPIDVLFVGNFVEAIDPEIWQARHPSVPAVIVDILFDAARSINLHFPDALQAVAMVSAARGIDVAEAMPLQTLCDLVTKVGEISEGMRRAAVLRDLARFDDLKIVACANALPESVKAFPNIDYRGYVEFPEIRVLMGQSRIVLNATNKFFSGAHERIWYGMAEAAVVLTDPSFYLDEYFSDGDSILYLPDQPDPGALARIVALAHSPEELATIATNAAPIYRSHHTWRARIKELLAIGA